MQADHYRHGECQTADFGMSGRCIIDGGPCRFSPCTGARGVACCLACEFKATCATRCEKAVGK